MFKDMKKKSVIMALPRSLCQP